MVEAPSKARLRRKLSRSGTGATKPVDVRVKAIGIVAALILLVFLVAEQMHDYALEGRVRQWLGAVDDSTMGIRGNRVRRNQQLLTSVEQTLSSAEGPRRVLLVGLINSIEEIFENQQRKQEANDDNQRSVVNSIGSLCHSLARQGGSMEVNLLYHMDHQDSVDDSTLFQDRWKQELQSSSCQVTLLSQDRLLPDDIKTDWDNKNRFSRLAILRSLQRKYVLQHEKQSLASSPISAVISMDWDLLSLPTNQILNQAMERVSSSIGTDSQIVCANGFETWNFNWIRGVGPFYSNLYYDALAAVDLVGLWYNDAYSTNVLQVVSFGQATLFQRIATWQNPENSAYNATSTQSLWPMQSCFGGMAIYNYATWSTQECDYDASQITLQDESLDSTWKLARRYQLNDQGDTCEHVTFQQCLQAAAKTRSQSFRVGIQPNLVVEREANLLSTPDAQAAVFAGVVVALALCLVCCTYGEKVIRSIYKTDTYSAKVV